MEIVNQLDIDGNRWEITDSQARQDIAALSSSSDSRFEEVNDNLEKLEKKVIDIQYYNGIPSIEVLKNAKALFVAIRTDSSNISSFQAVFPNKDSRIFDISTGTIKYNTVKWDKVNGSFTQLPVYEMSFMVMI